MTDNQPSEANTSRQPEIEYDRIIAFYEKVSRRTQWGILALVGVAAAFFYSNLREVRTDATEAVGRIEKAAAAQISQVRDEAGVAARSEARHKVEEAFASNNINELIDSVARKRVSAVAERQISAEVDRAVDKVREQILEVGYVGTLESRMRLGFRKAFDAARDKASNSPDPVVRQFARDVISAVADDYDQRIGDNVFRLRPNTALQELQNDVARENAPGPKSLHDIIQVIRKDSDLNTVALAFLAFREVSGSKIKMFDLEGITAWCAQNAGKCE